jgi:transposase
LAYRAGERLHRQGSGTLAHEPQRVVHSCYEAGRDGWWLHRWISSVGVDNIVVDPARIEVNRRSRRAKTHRLDADKLLAMLGLASPPGGALEPTGCFATLRSPHNQA